MVAVLLAIAVLGIAMGAFVRDPVTVRRMAGWPPELAHAGL
jgi:hypothetical protein